jgi:hypothetical protein
MTKTKAERISDTISWYPTKTIMPRADSIEIIGAAINDIHHEICNQRPTNSICALDKQQREAIKMFTSTFKSVIDPNNRFTYLSDSDDDDDDSSTNENAANPEEHITTSPTLLPPSNTCTNPAAPQRVTSVPSTTTPQSSPTPQRVRMEAPIEVATDTPTLVHNDTIAILVRDDLPHHQQPSIVDTIATNNKTTWPQPTKFLHGHYTRASAKVAYILAHAPPYAFFGNATNPDTGRPAEYNELSQSSRGPKWIDGMTLEIGKLLGTETMKFIPVSDIPPGTRITYARIVCADRHEKENPIRVRVTIGGNLITYDGTTSTKAAEMPTVKIFINSVISTPNAKFMTGDLKDFYLNTAKVPRKDFAYMKLPINILPPAILAQYQHLTHKEFMDTHRVPLPPDVGNTTPATYNFYWSSMILVSNIPIARMRNISSTLFVTLTRSRSTGTENATVASF